MAVCRYFNFPEIRSRGCITVDVRTRARPFYATNRDRAVALRRSPTDAEERLWYWLRRRHLGGWRFRRQAVIGPFIVDFVCLAARLIVEVDGSQHADNAADVARTRWLEGEGYRVIRFWNDDVLTATETVVEAIGDALGGRLPPPP